MLTIAPSSTATTTVAVSVTTAAPRTARPAGYPTIEPAPAGAIATLSVAPQFDFGSNTTVTLDIDVNASVYQGARRSAKNAVIAADTPESVWIPAYYRAFIDDPLEEETYAAVLASLRHERDILALDSDRYLELVTLYVQSMPYETRHGAPKFPVETIAENGGDCDDRSLLLAALLSREGFNVSLLYFSDENHMAVGAASDDFAYRETGYAYIETTNVSYVGIAPESIQGDRRLESDPVVIRIGEGESAYQSGGETRAIEAALVETRTALIGMLGLNGGREELHRLISSGTADEYYIEHNAADASYPLFLETLDAYTYLATHPGDRPAAAAWLRTHALP
jgi:hypothetical protein